MVEIHRSIAAEIPRLRRYARTLASDVAAADDLVQDCLTRALCKLHLWREGSDLRAWLFTILHNQYINQVRRSVREGTAIALSESEPALTRAATQGRHLELRDLVRAMGKLPGQQRSVIVMVALEGMPYEEVAKALGVPVGTVRSRLSRGREALRQLTGVVPDPAVEPAAVRTTHLVVDARCRRRWSAQSVAATKNFRHGGTGSPNRRSSHVAAMRLGEPGPSP